MKTIRCWGRCLLQGFFDRSVWTGPFAGKPYSGLCPTPDLCPALIRCIRGFTREYGGGGNGERRVETGQQVRPLRG
ncbi:hypothetical protein CHN49_25400 [Pseudomonas putida]|nr:hypothetical protein CHN49_25400 [Pseudomonas putida]